MQTVENIEKIVRESGIPDYVADLRFKLDTDSTGDPAVYISFIVSDQEAEKPGFFRELRSVEERIFSSLLAAQVKEWPYFHVRTVSEQKDLEEELKEELAEERRKEQEEGVS